MTLPEQFTEQHWLALDPLRGFVAMATFTTDQRSYRFRNDDGTQTSATWKAAQNTAISQGVNQKFRLRMETQETAGGAANNVDFTLQYNLNNTGWVTITSSSNVVRLIDSAFVADNTPTTNQLTAGTGTFRAGSVIGSSESTGRVSFVGSDHTEHEWILTLVQGTVNNNDNIIFRVLLNATPTDTTSATPTLTAVVAQAVQLEPEDLTVTNETTEPNLTQNSFIDSDNLENDVEVTEPTISQVHSVVPDDLTVISEVTATNVTEQTLGDVYGLGSPVRLITVETAEPVLVELDDSTITSEISEPTLVQNFELQPNDVTIASELSEPSLLMAGSLDANDSAVESEVSEPQVTSKHSIQADDLTVANEVSSPAISQVNFIAPNDLTVNVQVTDTELLQSGSLQVDNVEIVSETSQPQTTQKHFLAPNDVTVQSVVEQSQLLQRHDLSVEDLAVESEPGAPALWQHHTLLPAPVGVDSDLSDPALSSAGFLAADGAVAACEVTSPTISAKHYLQPNDLVCESVITEPTTSTHTQLVAEDLSVVCVTTSSDVFEEGERISLGIVPAYLRLDDYTATITIDVQPIVLASLDMHNAFAELLAQNTRGVSVVEYNAYASIDEHHATVFVEDLQY
jgi:hypothetical protein